MTPTHRFARRIFALLAALSLSALVGCAGAPQTADLPVYKSSSLNRLMDEQIVTVTSAQVVKIKEDASNFNSYMGSLTGGAVGGLVANNVGKGRGRTVATAAGAAVGAVVGNAIQEAGSYQLGLVFSISYTDLSGSQVRKTVIQPADNTIARIAPGWRPGARFPQVKARLVQGYNGDRILPL